jgi:hypothetical protein
MMKLGAFFHPTGNHVAAWLHPDAQIDAGTNYRHYADLAQTACSWVRRRADAIDPAALFFGRGEGQPELLLQGSRKARLVRLSYLAPDITHAILDGRQPRDLTAEKLLDHSRLPLAWHDQRTALGFA